MSQLLVFLADIHNQADAITESLENAGVEDAPRIEFSVTTGEKIGTGYNIKTGKIKISLKMVLLILLKLPVVPLKMLLLLQVQFC